MACRLALQFQVSFQSLNQGRNVNISSVLNVNRHPRHFHRMRRFLHSHASQSNKCQFGFLFDIDGVIVRGRKPLPLAKEAFELLTDGKGKFKVPTLFVTNAGNSLRSRKAQQLSEWLNIDVSEEQVVMSHSPLKMFRQFHDKHVLVNGQGPIKEIAHNVGFNRVTTVDELGQRFPNLDKMDHQRGKAPPCAFEEFNSRIEAIILFGEPVRWETPLQLIIDTLLSNGKPCSDIVDIPYPHLPLLACNMDLLWMSEARMPRLGHGCFMNALESLYQKISGKELKYTALIGKPSEITYHHADYLMCQQAKLLGVDHIRTIYCIGDNPETDIYGGNLYNRYLHRRRMMQQHQEKAHLHAAAKQQRRRRMAQKQQHSRAEAEFLDEDSEDEGIFDTSFFQRGSEGNVRVIRSLEEDTSGMEKAHSCESILVCTGVFNKNSDFVTVSSHTSSHNHRDFVIDPTLTRPNHVVSNVYEAVKLAFDRETFAYTEPLSALEYYDS